MRKLLICPWFGPLPPWWARYRARRPAGYDLLLLTNLDAFRRRVEERLGVSCPIREGDGKIHDYRPSFGELFADELEGYDFWGHTDFDCVYGRVGHFMPDERLAELDIHSDHWSYLCGPWTLYRNTPAVNEAFRLQPDWQDILTDPVASGWVETSFTQVVNESGLRVAYEFFHGYDHPDWLTSEDGALLEAGREISFFHFRHTKRWPVGIA